MAKLNETYNFGDVTDVDNEKMLTILADMYTDLATAINKKPDVYQRSTDGLATDTFLNNGDININTATDKIEMISNHTSPTNVTWTTIS